MDTSGSTSPGRSYALNSSPLSRLSELLKDVIDKEVPQLNDFTNGRLFLTKLGTQLSNTLQSSKHTPISYDLAKMIDFGFRYFLNEIVTETKNSCLSSNALTRLHTPPTLSLDNSDQENQEVDKLKADLFFVRNEKENLTLELENLKTKVKNTKESLIQSKNQYSQMTNQSQTKINDLQASLKQTTKEREEYRTQVNSLHEKYVTSLNDIRDLENKMHKIDAELTSSKRSANISKAKVSKLENQIENLQQTISTLSESANSPVNSRRSSNANQNSFTEMKLSPQREVSNSYKSTAQETLKHAQEKLDETNEDMILANKLKAKIEEEISKEIELPDNAEQESEQQNERFDALNRSISDLEEEKSKLLGGLNYYKQIVNDIKDELDFKGNETEISSNIKLLISKSQQNTENFDERSSYESLINGLVNFIAKFVNNDDVTSIPLKSLVPINKNESILETVKSAVTNSLNLVSESNETPIFEASTGSDKAVEDIMNILMPKKNYKVFAVVSLLSSVNGRLIEIINEKNRRTKSLLQYFPDSSDDNILNNVLDFVRNLQSTFINAKHILTSQFQREIDDQNDVRCISMFVDECSSVLTNMEVELRPILGSDTDFAEIPIKARTIIDELKQTSLSSTKANKTKQEEEFQKLISENSELRNNILQLQTRCNRYTQQIQAVEAENIGIKKEMNDNKLEFEKKIEKIMKDEQDKYVNELQKVQKAYDDHKAELELKNLNLSSKLKASQQNAEELSLLYQENASKLREKEFSLENISPTKNFDSSYLIPILSQCFVVTGQWNESKIQKAVATLIARLQRLEKERATASRTPRK